jgi:glucuronate isomerase
MKGYWSNSYTNRIMAQHTALHPDRLFPADPGTRNIARRLYQEIKNLPIISAHGHTDPRWFALNQPFENAVSLLLQPDHYVLRMLYSLGVPMKSMGLGTDPEREQDPEIIWRIFADHYYAFRGTPSHLWMEHVFAEVFGITEEFSPATASNYYQLISTKLSQADFLPRNLFEKFNIELLATTESPIDDLRYHQQILDSGWKGRVITAFRPDPCIDPEFEGFRDNLDTLAALTNENTLNFAGYLAALENRREYFRRYGATSTDHGHLSAQTTDLSDREKNALFAKITSASFTPAEAELFRAQMLTEMARMSLRDGMVMQIHPGAYRNHNPALFRQFGRDKGADIPLKTEYVHALKPLLDKFGNEPGLTIILFTLDETTYSRELAPLAGHYPALKLGPAWWFHDSPEGMRRYREHITETAGFYNTVGFNDDTRAFLSIPARHDVARRCDSAFLARLVAEHRISETAAAEVAMDLTYRLAKRAYKI